MDQKDPKTKKTNW